MALQITIGQFSTIESTVSLDESNSEFRDVAILVDAITHVSRTVTNPSLRAVDNIFRWISVEDESVDDERPEKFEYLPKTFAGTSRNEFDRLIIIRDNRRCRRREEEKDVDVHAKKNDRMKESVAWSC